MPILPTEVFEMDRRQLLKLTGAMGIGATFINPHELYAAGLCDKIKIENNKVDFTQAGATLQFWIDGLHFGGRTDLKSRANITLFMDLFQTSTSFVESVVIVGPDKKTIGARYFDVSMKMKDGHVPYVRFENIELDHTATYKCIYTVKSGSTTKLYTATIDKPEVSRLNTTWMPQDMRDDFKNFLIGTTANPTAGLITTQFQFYTKNNLADHTARGRMINMNSDGDFTIKIDFMHGDTAAKDPSGKFYHYMRYFIVMDPVGRLLGFYRRNQSEGPNATTQTSGAWNVTRITPAQKTTWNIPDLQVANIADCPYIQFYTEDSFDAIARNMIRLR